MRSIMIAGTNSGSGKTTVTCGILRALSKRGYILQPYKVGPDYIDTAYHKLSCAKSSKNLDEFILGKEEIKNLYSISSALVDISVIEGVMGLFDGYQADSDYCSSASISKILQVPVILLMDCKAMAASAAAMAQGFVNYDKDVKIAGFILNNVNTDNHYNILKKAIEKDMGLPVIGRLPKEEEITLSSRHLGLIPQGEVDSAAEKIEKMAVLVEKYVDLEKLIQISEMAATVESVRLLQKSYDNLTLAVAMDKAFHFYYEDSLELFKSAGINIVYFSPMNDPFVPDCHGIYIGGGYPEIFAKELANNISIRKHLKQLSEKEMPIYAECGGLMYLGEALEVQEETGSTDYPMVGIFSGKSIMSKGLKRFGYCMATLQNDSILGKAGTILRGHEFHHSVFETNMETVYKMEKLKYDGSMDRWSGGYIKGNTLASYLHIHFCSDYQLLYHFCDKMEEYGAANI